MVVRKGEKGTFQDGKCVFSQEQVTKIITPSEWYESEDAEAGRILIRSYERRALFDQMMMKNITKEKRQALYEQAWRSYE